MRLLKLLLFSLFLSFGVRAQFVQEIEGEYFGKSITQADLDHLFAKGHATNRADDYTDSPREWCFIGWCGVFDLGELI